MSEPVDLKERARLIFPNQGMHRNAEFLVDLHPRAIDYLEQAPVLAASFGVKFNTKADRLYIASRIGGPISRGERLRNVMASVGLQTPLRKLSGFAITPRISEFVRDLSDLPSSALSQAIPDKPLSQREWLTSLRQYRERMKWRGGSVKNGFQWIARHAHLCERGQAADIADFIFANPAADFDRYSFQRMTNEVQLWHDRLAADDDLRRYGMALKPDTLIDLSDWPDHVSTDHFEFFKLATPSMLMEEGRRMRHCVASYIRQVINGKCHIYSMRADMRRVATVEIALNRVTQIKGFGNKHPAQSVIDAANKFAREHRPTPKEQ